MEDLFSAEELRTIFGAFVAMHQALTPEQRRAWNRYRDELFRLADAFEAVRSDLPIPADYATQLQELAFALPIFTEDGVSSFGAMWRSMQCQHQPEATK
jgi:hypothetical protein